MNTQWYLLASLMVTLQGCGKSQDSKETEESDSEEPPHGSITPGGGSPVYVQPWSLDWSANHAENQPWGCNGLAHDADNNLYMSGFGRFSMRDPDHSNATIVNTGNFVKKFSTSGEEDKSWEKTFVSLEIAGSAVVAVDSQSNIVVAGAGWIKKFFPDGSEDPVWDRTFEVNGDRASPFAILVDTNDEVYLAGASTDFGWWLKKFGATGDEDPAWNKISEHGGQSASIAMDPDGSVYLAGYESVNDPKTLPQAGFVRKFLPTGDEDVDWKITILGKTSSDHAEVSAIVIMQDETIRVAGSLEDHSNTTSTKFGWLREFSPEGAEEASRSVVPNDVVSIVGLSRAHDESIFAIGYGFNLANEASNNDWFIAKYLPDGSNDAAWNKTIDFDGGIEQPAAIISNTAGNVFACGMIEGSAYLVAY